MSHSALKPLPDRELAETLKRWQKTSGRHGLPWMVADPYFRWLSEVMLQQTQVSVVIEYFARFTAAFETVNDLARATEDEVMQLWAGLGYYSRARNLHACAKAVAAMGGFPRTRAELEKLPGIGRSTAAAVASFAFGASEPIMDGNVRRVFSRLVCLDLPNGSTKADKALWRLAEELCPEKDAGVYNQALMDLGAGLCSRRSPKCSECPLRHWCRASALGKAELYPPPKVKKERQRLAVTLCVYMKEGCVLMEQRNGEGVFRNVWKGLWALPVYPESAPELEAVAHVEHTLTHLQLSIDVCAVRADKEIPACAGKWVRLQEVTELALPAPLAGLFADPRFIADIKSAVAEIGF